MKDAARLGGVSEDTLRRTDLDKIVQLGPRRLGMRVKDAPASGREGSHRLSC
jgi:hypothetical protein